MKLKYIITIILGLILIGSASAIPYVKTGIEEIYCRITGCSMQGDINMNNHTINNAWFVNATYVNATYFSINISNDSWINSTLNNSYIPYTGAIKNIDLGRNNLILNSTIIFNESSGSDVQNIIRLNSTGGDDFEISYWYNFENAFDDRLVFIKRDGNDAVPDGGFAWVMQNSTGNNDTILTLDGDGKANFTDNNIHTTGNISANNFLGNWNNSNLYAKLDGSNQPFTGHVNMSNNSSLLGYLTLYDGGSRSSTLYHQNTENLHINTSTGGIFLSPTNTERFSIRGNGETVVNHMLGVGTLPTTLVDINKSSDTDFNASDSSTWSQHIRLKNALSGAKNFAGIKYITESNGEGFFGLVTQDDGTGGDFVWSTRDATFDERLRLKSDGALMQRISGTGDFLSFNRTDTGKYYTIDLDNNDLNIMDGTTRRLVIDTTGKIGINTSTPETLLHIFQGESNGAVAGTGDSMIIESNSNNYLNLLTNATSSSAIYFSDNTRAVGGLEYRFSDNLMRLRAGGSTRLSLVGEGTTAGNIGIGTEIPNAKLDIYGNLSLTDLTSTGGVLMMQSQALSSSSGTVMSKVNFDVNNGSNINYTAVSLLAGRTATGGGGQYRIYVSNNTNSLNQIFTILSDGSIGMNTASPARTLSLYKSTTPVLQLVDATSGVASGDGMLLTQNGLNSYIENGETGNMYLRTGGTTWMTINGTGSVGIGTESPKSTLNVIGNANITGNITGSFIYGEMWNKSDSGFETIDLVTTEVYVRVINLTAGNLNGFSYSNGNLTASTKGVYQLNAKIGAISTAIGGEYGMKAYINDIGQDDCYDHKEPATEPIGFIITCIINLNAGDRVNIRFDDHADPVRDITLLNANVNLIRIGN